MIPASAKAVVFDAVGTLIDPDPPPAEVYSSVAGRHGCSLPLNVIRSRFRAAFQREEQVDAAAGWTVNEERERRRWRSIVGSTFEEHPAIEAIFAELFEHFARPAAWRLMEDAGEVLRELAGRGLQLGLASNFDRRLHRIADAFPGMKQISIRIISSEVGWRKPARQFFEAVIGSIKCEPTEIVFVGDRRDLDYDASRAVGLHAILFNGGSEETSGARRIRHLTELI